MGSLLSSVKKNKKSARAPVVPHKPPIAAITEKDRAILDLKIARDKLQRYRKKLEKDVIKLQTEAASCIRMKQKNKALIALKFKKYKEVEADKLDGALLNVLKMIEDVEWEYKNMEVLRALNSGTEALKKLHEEMSVDDVVSLLEGVADEIEVENRINGVIAGQLSSLDDESLLQELDTLIRSAESHSNSLPDAPTSSLLPQAPDGLLTQPAVGILPSTA